MNTIINDLLKNDGEGLINVAFALLCAIFAIALLCGVIVYLVQNWVLLAMLVGTIALLFIGFVINDKIKNIWEN